MRTELAVGDRREVAAAARVADRVLDRLAGKAPRRHLEPSAARSPQHEEALARPGQDLDLLGGAARDRRHDVHLVAGAERALGRRQLVVDEQRDVPAQPAPFVQHPAGQARMCLLEPPQRLADGRARDLHLVHSARQLPQRRR